jgi:hypothetical protein
VAAAARNESNDGVNRVERGANPVLRLRWAALQRGAVVECAADAPVAVAWTGDDLRLPVAGQGRMSRLKRLSLRAQFLRLDPVLA